MLNEIEGVSENEEERDKKIHKDIDKKMCEVEFLNDIKYNDGYDHVNINSNF